MDDLQVTSIAYPLSGNALMIASGRTLLDYFGVATGWGGSAAVANIATTVNHVGYGTLGIKFDKIAGDTTAMIDKTITAIDISTFATHAILHINLYVSSVAALNYAFVRLGTDNANYCEWRCDAGRVFVGWNDVDFTVTMPDVQAGNGYNLSSITYIAYGMVFNNATDTLTNLGTCAWSVKRVLETIGTQRNLNYTSSGTVTTDVAGAGNTVECIVSPGSSTVGCQVVGLTALGNLLRFEATTDGTNWTSIYTSMGTSAVVTTGQDGIYQLAGAGYVKVRVRGIATWNAGSVSISFNSTVGASSMAISTPLPQGTNLIGSVGVSSVPASLMATVNSSIDDRVTNRGTSTVTTKNVSVEELLYNIDKNIEAMAFIMDYIGNKI